MTSSIYRRHSGLRSSDIHGDLSLRVDRTLYHVATPMKHSMASISRSTGRKITVKVSIDRSRSALSIPYLRWLVTPFPQVVVSLRVHLCSFTRRHGTHELHVGFWWLIHQNDPLAFLYFVTKSRTFAWTVIRSTTVTGVMSRPYGWPHFAPLLPFHALPTEQQLRSA